MSTLSIREARIALSNPEKLFRHSKEVVVTRHGKPIFRLMPLCKAENEARSAPSRKELRAMMPLF